MCMKSQSVQKVPHRSRKVKVKYFYNIILMARLKKEKNKKAKETSTHCHSHLMPFTHTHSLMRKPSQYSHKFPTTQPGNLATLPFCPALAKIKRNLKQAQQVHWYIPWPNSPS